MNLISGTLSIALVAGLAGCASPSGTRSEPTPNAAASHEHDTGMMAGMCPMAVSGTTAAASDVDGGVDLAFTTMTGDVTELRQRVHRMAEMHNGRDGQMMGGHGESPPGASAEHQHGKGAGAGQDGRGGGGMMMSGGMMMPAATASAEDIERGASLVLRPKDPAQLVALREHVHMKAKRMASGECPMMSPDADHDAHHPGT